MPRLPNQLKKKWHISKSFVSKEDADEFVKEKKFSKGTSNKDTNKEISTVYYSCKKDCRCDRKYKMYYPISGNGCYLSSEGEEKVPGCWENNFAVHEENKRQFLQDFNSKLPAFEDNNNNIEAFQA